MEPLQLTLEPTDEKKISDVWATYTDDFQPWKKKSAKCRYCFQYYNHHKKSEQAITHLNACAAFRKLMFGLEVEERPEWFGQKRRRSPTKKPNTMDAYTIPSLTATETNLFEKSLAMHFYVTGTPFQRVEDSHFMKALTVFFFFFFFFADFNVNFRCCALVCKCHREKPWRGQFSMPHMRISNNKLPTSSPAQLHVCRLTAGQMW